MEVTKTLRVVGLVFVFALCVLGYVVIEGRGEIIKNNGSDARTLNNERQEYLKKLWSTTSKGSKEHIASKDYDIAIRSMEESLSKLEERDYEEFPATVARFYSTLAGTYFAAASDYMDHARQLQVRCVNLYEKSGDFSFLSLELSSLANYHFLQGDLKVAEDTHKRAIAYAERVTLESKRLDRDHAVFHAKMSLMNFYSSANRNEEARRIAKELEMMIQNGQITEWTKQDIEDMLH